MSRKNRHNNGYIGNSELDSYFNGVFNTSKQYLTYSPLLQIDTVDWSRPSDWLPMPEFNPYDQIFSGLLAIYPGASGNTGTTADSNFVAFRLGVTGTCAGYIVDWGNGITQFYTVGATAQYQYNYSGFTTTTSEGFRQVLIKAYPISGCTMTSVNLQVKYLEPGYTFHNTTGTYPTNWLHLKTIGATVSSFSVSAASRQTSLNALTIFEYVGPSLITNIGQMFYKCYALKEVIGTEWTKNCTSFSSVFFECFSLIKVSDLNTSLGQDFSNAFYECRNLKKIPNIDLSKATTLSQTFFRCRSLETVTKLNAEICTNFSSTFSDCYNLKSVRNILTRSAANMSGMFSACASLEDIGPFDTKNVTNFSSMFSTCYSLKAVPPLNTEKATNMSSMFSSSYNLKTIPPLQTRNVTTFSSMFSGCYSLRYVPDFDGNTASNFSYMFNSCYSLEKAPKFLNVSVLTDVNNMFAYCESLESVELFDTSKVTNFSSMFVGCRSLREIPNFNFSRGNNFSSVFSLCSSILTLPKFDFINATNMFESFGQMHSLKSISFLRGPSAANVSCQNLFSVCPSLGSVSGFTLSGNPNLSSMFFECHSLSDAVFYDTNASISYLNCNLSPTALNNIFTNLGLTGSGKTINITGNWGACGCNRSIAQAKGWSVTG